MKMMKQNESQPAALAARYADTRRLSEAICEPLEVEDFVVQSMADASPARWHLAHTTWFFDTFVLARWQPDYRPVHPDFAVLFNSYYESVGKQFPRARRGLLTRPTVAQVFEYRRAVDERMTRLFDRADLEADTELAAVVELGINHEQQHQELMLTDLKHLLSCNPLWPAYQTGPNEPEANAVDNTWHSFDGGVVEIGSSDDAFAFDNERPRHKVFLQPYELAGRLVTNGDYLRFIDEGGYRTATSWLSLGWNTVREQQWTAPLYWLRQDDRWFEFTLGGLRPLRLTDPVCHVSYFEADAFARWSGARLPTEAEWEHAAAGIAEHGGFSAGAICHPWAATSAGAAPAQMFGQLWQWTSSSYSPYPGYRPPEGALGEYNGKFMCNQYVLRGSSCATPAGHARATYRNFFPPEARWQFTGLRLARDAR